MTERNKEEIELRGEHKEEIELRGEHLKREIRKR